MSANVRISKNPLTKHFLTLMRDRGCPGGQFRFYLNRIAYNLTYEMFSDPVVGFPHVIDVEGQTPLNNRKQGRFQGKFIESEKIALFSVMRSGMSMGSTMHEFLPSAVIGHAGFDRDKGYKKIYDALPKELDDHFVILYDSDIVTGRSVLAFLDLIAKKYRSFDFSRLVLVTVVVSKPASEKLGSRYPGLQIYCAAQDEKITPDEQHCIPGLGNIKQRIFGPYSIDFED
ncbi:MAG: uracil phosphoribosyltransferase [Pseudomonadota bacterium]